MQGRRRPSRAVLIARAGSFAVFLFFLFNLSHDIRRARRWPVPRRRYKGGNGGGVPPLPIPNREVKPACADGTAERRESRQPPSWAPAESEPRGLFLCPLVPPSSRPYSPGRAFPRRKARRCAPECIPGGAAVPFAVGKHARAPRPGRRACGLASRSGRGGHACDQSHVQFLASVSRKGTQKS